MNIKILLTCIISLIFGNVNAQIPSNCSAIDSVFIFSIDFDAYYIVSVPRTKFEEYLYSHGKYDILKDRDKIDDVCKLIKDLKPVFPSNLSYSSNYKKIIIDKRNVPRFIDTDPLDIRSLVVLEVQNNQVLIWISQMYTEIGCERYFTSDQLYSYLRDYNYRFKFKK